MAKKPVLRCRASASTRNIWRRQCQHPATGERAMVIPGGLVHRVETLPACGVHQRIKYAVDAYVRDNRSAHELPVALEITR